MSNSHYVECCYLNWKLVVIVYGRKMTLRDYDSYNCSMVCMICSLLQKISSVICCFRWQIVLVDQSDRFVFKPLLYELLTKGKDAPLNSFLIEFPVAFATLIILDLV